MKTDFLPAQALEMGNEIQSHLNRVMADVQELANFKYDDEIWAGTVYEHHQCDPEDQTKQW